MEPKAPVNCGGRTWLHWTREQPGLAGRFHVHRHLVLKQDASMKAGRRDGVGLQCGMHDFNGCGLGTAGDLHPADRLTGGLRCPGPRASGNRHGHRQQGCSARRRRSQRLQNHSGSRRLRVVTVDAAQAA